MLLYLLAQAQTATTRQIAPEDKALIHLMLIGVVLTVGLLMVIGLLIAWRNYNQRQRDLDMAREERDADVPRPDAWATAAQRIESEDSGPDEAHVSHEEPQDDQDTGFDEPDDEEEDDEDDFPFNTGDDEDDDGPIGRA